MKQTFVRHKVAIIIKLILAASDLDKKNEDRSWCVGLCNRRSFLSIECKDRR